MNTKTTVVQAMHRCDRYIHAMLLRIAIAICCFCSLLAPLKAMAVDADSDGIADTVDIDDDNDGIPDFLELNDDGTDRDSDQDGMPDRLDLDSDNDGILDLAESGVYMLDSYPTVRVVGGRLRTAVGENGYADFLETSPDSRQMVFTLLNIDAVQDQVPDYLDLDSDNDGLSDLWEAGVPLTLDGNQDGRIDAWPGQVGADGILDSVQLVNDTSCCDYNTDGVQDIIPRNTDGGDLPDFQDLDSDNDSVYDVVEAGAADADGDGHIDGFLDDPNNPDGIDDVVVLVPLAPRDENQNGIPDVLEFSVQPSPQVPVEIPTTEQPVQPVDTPSGDNDAEGDPGESETPGSDDPEAQPATPANDDPDPQEQPINDGTPNPIQTGLSGGGCVLANHGHRAGFDPVLPAMLWIALCWILFRRRDNCALCRKHLQDTNS